MKFKRLISTLLVLILALSVPFAVNADTVTTVIACTDFQHPNGNESGATTVKGLLNTVKSYGITSADGFLCCGDYNYGQGNTAAAIDTLRDAVSDVVNKNMVFVRGNHDEAVTANVGLSQSGNNDTDAYGVFVINETDYMRTNSNENTIKKTAQNLINYLNDKLQAGYNKPIFVLSHLPLHYSMRTRQDGDAMHASYIFDALNAAGKKGLNIFFLYGHDHAHGWDDYLGGAAVYLKKGDSILIAQHSKTEFLSKTLEFTYMNAGFVGYYSNVNGADDTLTMTSFKISDCAVEIARYNTVSYHRLKSAGVRNTNKNESGYNPDTTVYGSPQTVTLTPVYDDTPIENLIEIPDPNKAQGERFEKITNVKDLDDGKYLLVYNSSTDYVMAPTVVKKSKDSKYRQGFDLLSRNDVGDDVLVENGLLTNVWTFEKSGDSWKIGNGEKYIKFTSTSDMLVTATLEDVGESFVISGSDGAFNFSAGGYVLNYNIRGLVNGFASNPAPFYIYKFVGYSVHVDGGICDVNSAKAGDTVTITTSPAPEGKVFDKWEYVTGSGFIDDLYSEQITFTMPDNPVKIKATYKDKPHSHNHQPRYDKNIHFDMCITCGDMINSNPHGFENACDTDCECGYVRTTNHTYGEYVYNGDATAEKDGTKTCICSVCGHTETVTAVGTMWQNPFNDIKIKDFYYAPTLWAVANDITTGTSKTTFSPEEACTRGQIVTFLWRAAGYPEPEATTMPFTDVKNSAYYRKAVLWAVENGITTGTSETTFSPNDPCTRGQIATFLWRANGKPALKSANMPFNDVAKKDFYYTAVLWAVENKITSGTSKTTFAPQDSCTRGQIVTFLYRAYN